MISQTVHFDVFALAQIQTVIVLVKYTAPYIDVLNDHLSLTEVSSELMDTPCTHAAYIYITITVHCDTLGIFKVVVLVGGCHVTVQVYTEHCVIVIVTYI
jgi:hypothetical protein